VGVTFEWDEQKAAANLRKHGVSSEEGASAFATPCRSRSLTQNIPRMKNDACYWA